MAAAVATVVVTKVEPARPPEAVADPALSFTPEPRPADDVQLFQGLLEGIANVEATAYRLLAKLGAPILRTVRTVGGGAGNPVRTAGAGAVRRGPEGRRRHAG